MGIVAALAWVGALDTQGFFIVRFAETDARDDSENRYDTALMFLCIAI